jgi:hypothetical protein
MRLGEKELRVVDVIAAILREVVNEALSLSGGEAPEEIRLTHPARWGRRRLEKLGLAAAMAGIENPTFVPEPVAAAVHFASERLSVGEHVAVYDLGGGTFDTAVLERTEEAFRVIGQPGGDEELGGEDFDDLLYRHLGEQLDGDTWARLRHNAGPGERAWPQANRELLRHARRAKEGLSRQSEHEFYMPQPIDREFRATASEFERLIGPSVRGTAAELERTILAAGLKPTELEAIFLAGGSSRIPLVGRIIQERLGVVPNQLDDPKAVIALGAARMGITTTPLADPSPEPTVAPPAAAQTAGGRAEPTWAAEPPRRSGPSAARPPTAAGSGPPGGAGAPPGGRPGARTAARGRPPSRFALWRADAAYAIRQHKLASLLMLLVVAGGIVAAVVLTRGSESMSPLEEALGDRFNAWNCEDSPIDQHEAIDHGIDDEAQCTPTDNGVRVGVFTFSLFLNGHHRNDFFNEEVVPKAEERAATLDSGICTEDRTGRSGSWYHDPDTMEERLGKAVCYRAKGEGSTPAYLAATYHSPLLARAVNSRGDPRGLWTWFVDNTHDLVVHRPEESGAEVPSHHD